MLQMLLPLIQGVIGQKQKKEQEQQAQRAAAARGEALRNVGNEGGLSGVVGIAGGLLGGNALGGQKTSALDDVDDALGSFDRFKGY